MATVKMEQDPPMATAKRVGIFGGSFDPVHLGHLLVARAAREEMKLDRLIFVPANRSPFKQESPPAPDALRLRMLRLALAGVEWSCVSDVELKRGGVSYSVDTVRTLGREFPGAQLFLLIGEDNLESLSSWREVGTLLKLVEFLVIPRPGAASAPELPGATLHRLTGWPIHLSSSQIRQRVRDGLPVDHLVADVIRHNRLYLP